jgi:ABC-type amino acid transport substrate-binding protein
MKMLAASAATLVFLCAPALADSALRPEEWLKLRFALRDTGSQTFDVVVGTVSPCATVNQKLAGQEVELMACVASASRLDITWSTRSSSSAYHSQSSIPAIRGTTTELGSKAGPRLEVTVQ